MFKQNGDNDNDAAPDASGQMGSRGEDGIEAHLRILLHALPSDDVTGTVTVDDSSDTNTKETDAAHCAALEAARADTAALCRSLRNAGPGTFTDPAMSNLMTAVVQGRDLNFSMSTLEDRTFNVLSPIQPPASCILVHS